MYKAVIIICVLTIVGIAAFDYADAKTRQSWETSICGESSDIYDASDRWMKSTFIYDLDYGGSATAIFSVDNTDFDAEYDADTAPSSPIVTWTDCLGTQKDHQVHTDCTTGSPMEEGFTDMTFRIQYYASQPQ